MKHLILALVAVLALSSCSVTTPWGSNAGKSDNQLEKVVSEPMLNADGNPVFDQKGNPLMRTERLTVDLYDTKNGKATGVTLVRGVDGTLRIEVDKQGIDASGPMQASIMAMKILVPAIIEGIAKIVKDTPLPVTAPATEPVDPE